MRTNDPERIVELAKKWLLEYFSDGVARKPGDLEDEFTGQWSFSLEPWRATPFFPALSSLVEDGALVFEVAGNGDFWYATPGNLPSQKVSP